MAGQAMAIQCEVRNGCATFRPDGIFDAGAARALRAVLEEVLEPQVVIDFSRVRQFVDTAVAVLAAGLQSRQVELRGLGRHQESVFRYFGVPVTRTPERPYYRAEELLAV